MRKLFFMTGTNSCGKSSIAQAFLKDPQAYEIPSPEYKTGVQVCPAQNMMILGRYSKVKTSGGCDGISKKAWMQEVLKSVWDRAEDIFMEGYLIGTKVWADELQTINGGRRQLIFLYPNTELDTCFKRIEGRSGKARHELKGNGANVVSKDAGVKRFRQWLLDNRPEWRVVTVDTEHQTPEECALFIKTL